MSQGLKDIKVDISNLDLDRKSPDVMSAEDSRKILSESADYVFGQDEVREALKELSDK